MKIHMIIRKNCHSGLCIMPLRPKCLGLRHYFDNL
nr:MAG TPA: hypothetical protein [Bacteriophage sp.]